MLLFIEYHMTNFKCYWFINFLLIKIDYSNKKKEKLQISDIKAINFPNFYVIIY